MKNEELLKLVKKVKIYTLSAAMLLMSGCSLKTGKPSVPTIPVTTTPDISSDIKITPLIPITPTPTVVPTIEPSITPTVEIIPTAIPTIEPTIIPTIEPTVTPTIEPTIIPTATPTVKPTVKPTATPVVEKKDYKYVKIDNFQVMNQNDFPTGCESVSTVMVLRHLGFDITKAQFIDNYLDKIPVNNDYYDKSENGFKNIYDEYFLGNPRSESGKACNPPVIQNAVEKYFNEIGETDYTCNVYTGAEFNDLIKKLEEGKPVLIWVTIDLKDPTRSYYLGGHKIYTSRHTCVLTGVDEEKNIAYIAEPLSGELKAWPLDRVIKYYNLMGNKAAVIEQKINTLNDVNIEGKTLSK